MGTVTNVLKVLCFLNALPLAADFGFETDRFATDKGELAVTCIGHGTLLFVWNDVVLHVDPVGQYADYSKLPKADIVLVTHEHGDHLDPAALKAITKEGTRVILAPQAAEKLGRGEAMKNGGVKEVLGVRIEAVPAYNTTPGRDKFHPKGRGNGYVLTFGGRRIYVAGDTEDIPEMKALAGIDVAFLPMNQPYTMTPAQAAAAAKVLKPKVLYPYHFGETRTSDLVELLKGEPGIDVRIRKLK